VLAIFTPTPTPIDAFWVKESRKIELGLMVYETSSSVAFSSSFSRKDSTLDSASRM
jgi:hypothetical protein